MLLKLPQAAAGVLAEGSTEGGSTSTLPTVFVSRLQLLTGYQASDLGSARDVDQRLLSFSCCYRLNACVPQKSYVEAPTPRMAVLGDAASKEVRISEGVRVGP